MYFNSFLSNCSTVVNFFASEHGNYRSIRICLSVNHLDRMLILFVYLFSDSCHFLKEKKLCDNKMIYAHYSKTRKCRL